MGTIDVSAGRLSTNPRKTARTAEILADGYEPDVEIVAECEEQAEAYLPRWLKMVDTWPDVTFPGLADGDRLARELVETVRRSLAWREQREQQRLAPSAN
jgi:hypothetical protein